MIMGKGIRRGCTVSVWIWSPSYTTFDWELKDHNVEIAKDGSVSAKKSDNIREIKHEKML